MESLRDWQNKDSDEATEKREGGSVVGLGIGK
jgi:hypothetical protein